MRLTVTGTLYQTFNKIPYGNELMQRLLGAFAWEMNMPQEVVPGDQIELLAIKKYALGNFIGYGKNSKRLLTAEKTHSVRHFFRIER